jgi:hypothetical protein
MQYPETLGELQNPTRTEGQAMKASRLGLAMGALVAVAMLAGCGGTLNAAMPSASRASSSSGYVYVTNLTSTESSPYASEIEYWPVGSTGNVPPTGVIAGPYTELSGAQGIVVNADGEIYVANSTPPYAILGFAAGSSGDVSPNATIRGSTTGLAHPDGLAFDAAGNLYVANCGVICADGEGKPSVEEFAAGSNGNVSPLRVIAGRRTQFVAPHGVAIGPNGAIYVMDIGSKPPSGRGTHLPEVDVFSAHAQGDRAPIRVVAGPNTKLSGTGGGLGLDADGFYVGSWDKKRIERFSLHAKGDAPPRALIRGLHTQLQCCLDGMITASATVYAVVRATGFGGSSPPEIIQFDGKARGDAAPSTNITGSNTGLYIPLWVYVR